MSSTTTNIGLTKMATGETIGQWSDANNGSGGNLDIIDTKMGPVGATSLQAQINALNIQLGKMTVHGVATASGGSCTITAIKNGEFILLFYAGHMTSIFLGGASTSIYTGGDDPADYGFTLARNDKVFTLTRTNGNDFQYAWLEIIN